MVDAGMEELANLVGIDLDSPIQRMAEALVSNDSNLHWELTQLRRNKGITIETVAERMGVSVEHATEFEAYWYDPKQSELRRYALAVEAVIESTLIDGPVFLAKKTSSD